MWVLVACGDVVQRLILKDNSMLAVPTTAFVEMGATYFCTEATPPEIFLKLCFKITHSLQSLKIALSLSTFSYHALLSFLPDVA